MYVCMYAYFDSVVHYTSYVNNVRQIKQSQIHPEPRPTPESLEDCGWVLSNSGWPNKSAYINSEIIDCSIQRTQIRCLWVYIHVFDFWAIRSLQIGALLENWPLTQEPLIISCKNCASISGFIFCVWSTFDL